MRLEEAVLRGLLGVAGAAGDEVRGAKGDLGMAVDELFVGIDVPARRARDELRVVVEWPAHHCQPYTTRAPSVP
jgi:hypothetical protein